MKIYIYFALHVCIQNKNDLINLNNYEYDYGNYETNDTNNIIVSDILTCPLFRFFYILILILNLFMTYGEDFNYLRDVIKKEKQKNKRPINVIFPSIFCRKKEIEFKILECNKETVLKIFKVRGSENYYYEIENGKVEVIYNGKRRKNRL